MKPKQKQANKVVVRYWVRVGLTWLIWVGIVGVVMGRLVVETNKTFRPVEVKPSLNGLQMEKIRSVEAKWGQ